MSLNIICFMANEGKKNLLVRVGERLCRLVEDQNKATKERRGRYCEC